jgi:hypothetical protein
MHPDLPRPAHLGKALLLGQPVPRDGRVLFVLVVATAAAIVVVFVRLVIPEVISGGLGFGAKGASCNGIKGTRLK